MSETSGKKFWKSLRDLKNDPDYMRRKADEFLEGVTDEFNTDELKGLSRRKFLALLSASAAFTAASCTDYVDKGEIIPYDKRPENILPGKPNKYASACDGCSAACGVLVKTREGRPVKIEGNPEHPVNAGKTCATGQASILGLYDPARMQFPLKNGREISWEETDKEITGKLKASASGGKEIALIAGITNSPSVRKLFSELRNIFPTLEIYEYELLSEFNRVSAWKKCYGSEIIPSVKWDQADIILTLEADILGKESGYIETTRKFSSRRDYNKPDNFNRLYAAEANLSLTGSRADYRIAIGPDSYKTFLLSLIADIGRKKGFSGLPAPDTKDFSLDSFAKSYGIDSSKLHYLIDDLTSHTGKSIVFAGKTLPEDVHILVNYLNELINADSMYDFNASENHRMGNDFNDFSLLAKKMEQGEVGAVIDFNSNFLFTLPENTGLKKAINKVETRISFTENMNETANESVYALPVHHYLESWGDALAKTNLLTLRQPVIAPIFNTRQKEAVLLHWMRDDKSPFTEDIYHKYLMDFVKEEYYSVSETASDFKNFWFGVLHEGFIKIKTKPAVKNKFGYAGISSLAAGGRSDNINLILQDNYYIRDGRFAANGWLQEIPHPISKVTWDNYAAISPGYAASLNVENGDIIRVKTDSGTMEIPVLKQPGLPDKTIITELGYGRKVISDAGKDAGFDSISLLNTSDFSSRFITTGKIKVEKTGKNYKLVSTQEHHAIDDEFTKDFHKIRDIIQEGTVEEFKNDPHFLERHKHEIFNITEEHKYEGVKWGMAIDMNKCTSCGTCVASCNVENNIPVVGKEQVAVGREMHWMRLDRYYSGTPDDPEVSHQPMLCQHCDNAPCENVCPVNATNHSPDGLNQMAYNRCVGTRYCANNCPYKVRRFNFFNFRDHFADSYYDNSLSELVNNPEVTVRSRGVMEKCTFCVQRIMDARSEAIREGRELKGEDVVTACQEVCPADAITFGDLNDPSSKISIMREHGPGYHVLEALNVRPNVTYMAKLRNTKRGEA